MIVDSIMSSDGVHSDPAGFLAPAARAVREAGGLWIADEVQPGFGRLGSTWWGFQRHGLVPDLAVMGKPMGNGVPIGAVVGREEVMAKFGRDIRYFNTFGGNPVSIAAATAVLDVIESEQLLDNVNRDGSGSAGGSRRAGNAGMVALAASVDVGSSPRWSSSTSRTGIHPTPQGHHRWSTNCGIAASSSAPRGRTRTCSRSARRCRSPREHATQLLSELDEVLAGMAQ